MDMSYIIGISGVRGAGKSTLGRYLSLELQADTLALGRHGDTLKSVYTPDDSPELFQSVANAPTLYEAVRILDAQAAFMYNSLKAVIDRCRRASASLILEGGQMTPGVYGRLLDLHIMLIVPRDKLEERMRSGKNRGVTPENVERNMEIQDYLINEAAEYCLPIIETHTIEQTVNDAMKLVNDIRTKR